MSFNLQVIYLFVYSRHLLYYFIIMKLIPYITFNGSCEEALTFYQDAMGGKIISIGRYEDTPMQVDDTYKKKILHARIQIGDDIFMASDSMPNRDPVIGNNISLSIEWDEPDVMETAYHKLAEGGKKTMPLGDMFWGSRFGMLIDKYGIHWMFNCEKKK
jgi:PhnB protein